MATILIIDDEPLTTEMLATFIRLFGHEAVEAYTCADARVRLGYIEPALILLDIMLPDMSGIDFCRELRAQPRFAEVPILMISATTPPRIEESQAAGATDYLVKPVTLHTVRSALNRMGLKA
jgi:DNA-binding response OmpR family regulator